MSQNFSDEIAWLKNRISENPSSMLFARLAERYLQLAETDHAIEVCRDGLKYHSEYATAHLILAKCFFAQKLYDEAEKQLKKAILCDPHYLMAHKLYSDLMSEIGWISSVEASYNKILEVDPLDKKIQHSLKNLRNIETEEPVIEESNLPYEDRAASEFAGDAAAATSSKPDTETAFFETPPADAEDNEPTTETLLGSSEEVETEFTPKTFEEEESRFSEILDDIFSPYLDEEESKVRPSMDQIDLEKDDSAVKPDAPEPSLYTDSSGLEAEPLTDNDAPDLSESALHSEMDKSRDSDDSFFATEESDAKFERDWALAADDQDDDEEPLSSASESDEMDSFSETDQDQTMESPLQNPSPPTIPPQTIDQQNENAGSSAELFTEGENNKSATRSQDSNQPVETDDFLAFEEPEEEFLNSVDLSHLKEENLEEQELDFSEFLSSLDVRDIKKETEQDIPVSNTYQGTRLEKPPSPQPIQMEKSDEQDEEPLMSVESRYSDTKEKFVTPTLGEIYAAQGQYAKAISVFEVLQKRHPDNEWYASKLEYLRKRLTEEQG
jgi:tetratricopeptide (TPR) repeat protein